MSVALQVLVVFTLLLAVLWVHDLYVSHRRSRRASQSLAEGRKRIGL